MGSSTNAATNNYANAEKPPLYAALDGASCENSGDGSIITGDFGLSKDLLISAKSSAGFDATTLQVQNDLRTGGGVLWTVDGNRVAVSNLNKNENLVKPGVDAVKTPQDTVLFTGTITLPETKCSQLVP